jgi:hypothetical protein
VRLLLRPSMLSTARCKPAEKSHQSGLSFSIVNLRLLLRDSAEHCNLPLRADNWL